MEGVRSARDKRDSKPMRRDRCFIGEDGVPEGLRLKPVCHC